MANRKIGPSLLIYRGPPYGTRAIRLPAGSPAQASAVAFFRAMASGPHLVESPSSPRAVASKCAALGSREVDPSGDARPRTSHPSEQAAAPFRTDDHGRATVTTDDLHAERPATPAPPVATVDLGNRRGRVQARRPMRDLALLGPDDLMTPDEMCRYLNIADSTGRNWRLRGHGPEHIRVSARCLRFRKATVDAWIRARSVSSTSGIVEDA